MGNSISVRGARVHNLRNVNVDIPRESLVAFTGISGSGKSSLAFGTIFAESQHRYLESVAPYARRLLQQLPVPDVDQITGLPPVVALEQRRATPSGRSTVGTLSRTSNSLRMLMSRAGTYPEGAPRLDSDAFSPNTAAGACPRCQGQGVLHEVTEASMVPDPGKSIADGAIASWPGAWQGKNLRDILATLGYDIAKPWRDLSQRDRDWILFTEDEPVVTVHPVREAHRIQRPYQGRYTSARRLVLKTYASDSGRKRAERFMTSQTCTLCQGRRLRQESLAVTFAGRDIAGLATMPVSELSALLRPRHHDDGPAGALTSDITDRIAVLEELGLGYLSLARPGPTLSSGELQRIRLATQLHAGLFGVVYVLDEPSAGLHPADSAALRAILRRLRDEGNTVCFVEHDLDVARAADWIVDVGPGAGSGGGQVLYSGPVPGLRDVPASVTRQYLFGDVIPPREHHQPHGWLKLTDITRNNLHGLSTEVPLGAFTAITGVSGAGKSTLLSAIAEAAGSGQLRVVWVDQQPIGRTPRSNLATYTGLFDTVRKLFAQTDTARQYGYGPSRFSFNVAGGRCETCQGEGYVAVELLFLPDTFTPCPACGGARYNPDTLRVRLHDRTVAQVLELTVDDAAVFFADITVVRHALDTLSDVGLGYLRLGQPATELSGGEAQRIKLAAELQRRRVADTIYLLDEPSTGLHPSDTDLLMDRLHDLVGAGGTVVVVEHDMRVAATADHLIDMGPGGGPSGGRIVAAGTPAQVTGNSASRTAPYLTAAIRSAFGPAWVSPD